MVTICTAQWSLYVPLSGHYMYRSVVTTCTAQWSLYVPHIGHYTYRLVVTICTAQRSLYVPSSGHYIYRKVVTLCTAQWSLYVPYSGHYTYRTVVTICNTQWSLYVPPSGHYMYHQFKIQQFYVLPTHCIYLFCVDLRTNSHYFPTQHQIALFCTTHPIAPSHTITHISAALTTANLILLLMFLAAPKLNKNNKLCWKAKC